MIPAATTVALQLKHIPSPVAPHLSREKCRKRVWNINNDGGPSGGGDGTGGGGGGGGDACGKGKTQ